MTLRHIITWKVTPEELNEIANQLCKSEIISIPIDEYTELIIESPKSFTKNIKHKPSRYLPSADIESKKECYGKVSEPASPKLTTGR